MGGHDTTQQVRISGEYSPDFGGLMLMIRDMRKEQSDRHVDVMQHIENLYAKHHAHVLEDAAIHARVNALEAFRMGHELHHKERDERAEREKLEVAREQREAAKAPPHWAIQYLIGGALTLLGGVLLGAGWKLTLILTEAMK